MACPEHGGGHEAARFDRNSRRRRGAAARGASAGAPAAYRRARGSPPRTIRTPRRASLDFGRASSDWKAAATFVSTIVMPPARRTGFNRWRRSLLRHDMLMGGGFGRRGNRDGDFIIDAVLMSKEAGRPVKVMWTREDDFANGRFRPISAHALKAGFDPSGKLTAWWHRIAVDRVGAYMDPVRYQAAGGKDFIAMLGADLRGYDVPHQLVEQFYRDTGVRTNPLRGISFIANRFATLIDRRRDRAASRVRTRSPIISIS